MHSFPKENLTTFVYEGENKEVISLNSWNSITINWTQRHKQSEKPISKHQMALPCKESMQEIWPWRLSGRCFAAVKFLDPCSSAFLATALYIKRIQLLLNQIESRATVISKDLPKRPTDGRRFLDTLGARQSMRTLTRLTNKAENETAHVWRSPWASE